MASYYFKPLKAQASTFFLERYVRGLVPSINRHFSYTQSKVFANILSPLLLKFLEQIIALYYFAPV